MSPVVYCQMDITQRNVEWNKLIEAASSDVRRLDAVVRFSSIPVSTSETVSAHTFWVCLYSIMIHRQLTGLINEAALEQQIMLYSLIHDIGEAVTGDIVRTMKYSSNEFKEAVDRAEESEMNKMDQSIKDVVSSCNKKSRDWPYIKAVVKAADFLSLFEYMNREWNRGNKEIRPFIERMRKDLKSQAESTKNGEWYEVQLSKLYYGLSEKAYQEFTMEVM